MSALYESLCCVCHVRVRRRGQKTCNRCHALLMRRYRAQGRIGRKRRGQSGQRLTP